MSDLPSLDAEQSGLGQGFAIWNFSVSGKWVKYGAFFPNFKLPFLGTELMRRGTSSLCHRRHAGSFALIVVMIRNPPVLC